MFYVAKNGQPEPDPGQKKSGPPQPSPPAFVFWTAAEVVNDVVKGAKIQISYYLFSKQTDLKFPAFCFIIRNFSWTS